MFSVGIVGGSGYTGAELLRLCLGHPELDVAWATADSQVGTPIAGLYPSLAAGYRGQSFVPFDAAMVDGVDLVFLALPHGASQQLVPDILARGCRVVDLAADFRLLDARAYERWYGEAHSCPELLGRLAYGLPELERQQIAKADGVASAGCYPTAAAVALAPLVQAGVIEADGVIVDAASGVSGADEPSSTRPTSAPPTRTSSPTASSTTATRRRSSRPPGPACSSLPTWRR